MVLPASDTGWKLRSDGGNRLFGMLDCWLGEAAAAPGYNQSRRCRHPYSYRLYARQALSLKTRRALTRVLEDLSGGDEHAGL